MVVIRTCIGRGPNRKWAQSGSADALWRSVFRHASSNFYRASHRSVGFDRARRNSDSGGNKHARHTGLLLLARRSGCCGDIRRDAFIRLTLCNQVSHRRRALRHAFRCTFSWHSVHSVIKFCSMSLPDWLRSLRWCTCKCCILPQVWHRQPSRFNTCWCNLL